jgi:predicted nucleic-acid-binding protein
LFARAAAGDLTLVVTDLALAETVWVLQSVYSLDRDSITGGLKDLIESTGIEVQNKAILLSAPRNFAQTDVDFVDAYHAAVATAESLGIASFDRDFDQFAGVKRIERKLKTLGGGGSPVPRAPILSCALLRPSTQKKRSAFCAERFCIAQTMR